MQQQTKEYKVGLLGNLKKRTRFIRKVKQNANARASLLGVKIFSIDKVHNNKKVRYIFWDVANNGLGHEYLRDADVIIDLNKNSQQKCRL